MAATRQKVRKVATGSKEILTRLEQHITQFFGKRCPEPCNGCACCQMWALYDLVKLSLFTEISGRH